MPRTTIADTSQNKQPPVVRQAAGGDQVVALTIIALTMFFLQGSKWWLYVALIAFLLWIDKTKQGD